MFEPPPRRAPLGAATTAPDRNANAAKSSCPRQRADFAAEKAPSGIEPLYEALQASA
jgi:hypothetical protein